MEITCPSRHVVTNQPSQDLKVGSPTPKAVGLATVLSPVLSGLANQLL